MPDLLANRATEIPAPSAGEILEILVQTGDTVPVGTVVARWTGSGHPATETDTASVPHVEASAAKQGNGNSNSNINGNRSATASIALAARHEQDQHHHPAA